MKSMCQEARRNSPSVAERRPDLLLLAHDLADRLVLDLTQLGRVDPAGGMRRRAPGQQSRAGGAGCRRGRRGTGGFVRSLMGGSPWVVGGQRWKKPVAASPWRWTSKRSSRRRSARNHRLVLGVTVEVEPRDRPASGARARRPVSSNRRASAGDEEREAALGVRAGAAEPVLGAPELEQGVADGAFPRRRRRRPSIADASTGQLVLRRARRGRARRTGRPSATVSSRLEGRRAQDDVPPVARAPTRARSSPGRTGRSRRSRARGSRTELKIGSCSKSGSPGKYICVTSRCVQHLPEDGEVDVGGTPCVLVVPPRIGAGLDRDEAVAAVVVGERPPGAGEVRVERRGMLVDLVRDSGRPRSPARPRAARSGRAPVVVEDAAGDDDPLAERFAGVAWRQVGVGRRDRVLAEHRPGQRDGAPRASSPARATALRARSSGSRDRGTADRRRSRVALSPGVRASSARSAVSSARSAGRSRSRSSATRRSQPVASRAASARRRGEPRSASARGRSPRGSRTRGR